MTTAPRLDTQRSFTGRRTPSWLVGPLQEERHKGLKQGVYDGLMAHAATAMETIGKLIKDPETPASVRAVGACAPLGRAPAVFCLA